MIHTNGLTFNLFFSFFIFSSVQLVAQNHFSVSDSRAISIGEASVTLQTPFAAFYNQAGLAGIQQFSAAFFYQQRYQTSDLTEMTGVMCLPVRTGAFALSIWQTGITGYHESRFGLAFAKKLGPRFSCGLQFSYFLMDFPECGETRGTSLFEMGVRYEFASKTTIGIHLFNPLGTEIQSLMNRYSLPAAIKFGAGFPLGNKLTTYMAASGDWNGHRMLHAGLDFHPYEQFSLRGGISGRPINYAAGVGYRWYFLQTDLAVSHHAVLGYSPSLSLTFNL